MIDAENLRPPVFLLGTELSGYIVRDTETVLLWTTEAGVSRFIETHRSLTWIPVSYTEITDTMTLLSVLRSLQGKGVKSGLLDLQEVDEPGGQLCSISDLMSVLRKRLPLPGETLKPPIVWSSGSGQLPER